MKREGNKESYFTLRYQLMYGIAEFFGGGCFLIVNTFFPVFMTKALGMPAALAGTIPLIGKVWDAITDPIMGNITDRTTSKLGAKRFYMLIGGIASSITFLLIWVTIPSKSIPLMYAFYICMYCLFSTGYTIFMVPYNGLLPDMIDDYAIRSKFSNMRMIWSTIGAMVSGIVPSMMIRNNRDKTAYLEVAILFAALYFIAMMTSFVGTWEKQKPPVKTKVSESFTQAISVYRSRSFRLFIGIYLCGQCAMDFVAGMAVYYVDDVLNGYQNGYFTYLMGALLLSQLVGMLFFGPLMAKTSKKFVILVGAPIRIVATLGLFFFSKPGGNIVPVLVLTAFIGMGNAATLTSIFAIMADMADVDELITSLHRPGTVSGMATFARKISAGLSAACCGLFISMVGYDSSLAKQGIKQSLTTQHGIVLLYILIPVILVTFLWFFGYQFPMTQKEFGVIKKEVARRKGEEKSCTTTEEKRICEKVTGLSYEKLWNPKNVYLRERI